MRCVLVANRGEIAVRVLRAARALGYRTVAVYSEADRDAVHVTMADQAVCLGPAPAAESYLSIERVLDAAKASGADAIHPGYGFLSERAAFAAAVRDAGLIFVGPSAAAILAMGDKSAAKARMRAAGVPCLPGVDGGTHAELLAAGTSVGFPLMVKARAGGGGRGMRLVQNADELAAALTSAEAEARAAFGDGGLLIERALLGARHVEVQIFGDAHGNVVHLGERDCSVQRRNQKVIEESPSPAVSPVLRAELGAAAVRAARAVDYVGAGTVEFMLDAEGAFSFLEMNTRLQVEHPVTELTCDVDLVAWQFHVAEGRPLPLDQATLDARRRGHAIEVRLCAEDAEDHPQTGRVLCWRAPDGAGIRVDAALADGLRIGADYDSMLGKIIAYGADREQARVRLCAALRETRLFGVVSNRDRLLQILEDPTFVRGAATTQFLSAGGAPKKEVPNLDVFAALAFEQIEQARLAIPAEWIGWQSATLAARARTLRCGERTCTLRVIREGRSIRVQNALFVDVEGFGDEGVSFTHDGVRKRMHYAFDGDALWIDIEGALAVYVDEGARPPQEEDAAASKQIVAKVVGKVVRLHTEVGASVEADQVLVVVESMKMEIELTAPCAGTVSSIEVQVGDQVQAGQRLILLR